MYNEADKSVTLIAGAVVAANRFVKFTTGGKVIQTDDPADQAIGVALEAAAADGDPINVAVYNGGIVPVTASDLVAAGVAVTSDADGKAIAAAADSEVLNGYSVTAAGAEDELVSIMLTKGGYVPPGA